MMAKVQKSSNTDCNIWSSEPFTTKLEKQYLQGAHKCYMSCNKTKVSASKMRQGGAPVHMGAFPSYFVTDIV
jgi:hypothetical protein